MKKIALIAALALAVFVVPAAAKDHPGNGTHATAEHANPHPCTPHRVAYVVAGSLESGTLAKEEDGTYSGELTVKVARANHHAKADKGTIATYALDHAKVRLHGQDPAALKPGSRVRLLGRTTRLSETCDQTGSAPTTTIRKASIKDPQAEKPAETQTETETAPTS